MDEREAKRKRRSVEQGGRIERLTSHPDWEFFQGYLEATRNGYDKKLHEEATRNDGIGMARAAEAYDAINSILEAIPSFIKQGRLAQKEIYELEHATERDTGEEAQPGFEPITGRPLK